MEAVGSGLGQPLQPSALELVFVSRTMKLLRGQTPAPLLCLDVREGREKGDFRLLSDSNTHIPFLAPQPWVGRPSPGLSPEEPKD